LDIQKLIEIVKEAGGMFKNRNFIVKQKGSASDKVTSMDIAVEKFLKGQLTQLIKNSGFMGEESDDHEIDNDYVWIVDPIDGTTNFVRDFRASCVSVALMHKGEVVQGVVYNPYCDELYSAEKGKGAYLNKERIAVSNMPFEKSILLTSMHPYYKDKADVLLNFIEEIYPMVDDTRRSGSAAIDLCNLACGRGDMSFKITLSPWDFAASVLIIREAGGIVGTVGNEIIRYDKNIPIFAANTKENYDKLYDIVMKHIKY